MLTSERYVIFRRMNRRAFLLMSAAGALAVTAKCAGISMPSVFGRDSEAKLPDLCWGRVMTVNGDIRPSKMGMTLPHEYLVRDFNGIHEGSAIRYDMEKVFNLLMPYLLALKRTGCDTLVDCTPIYGGRNVRFLQRLSKASGVNILTNTGCSGTDKNRYLPEYVRTDTVEDIAFRWIRESWYGIGGTGIRPGFIQIGVEGTGLSALHGKLFQAAGKAHLQTGLPIMVHASDSISVLEGLSLLRKESVDASALIWAHTEESDMSDLLEVTRLGAWICLDNVKTTDITESIKTLYRLKKADMLDHVLISQAHYWSVDEKHELKKMGEDRMYLTIFNKLIPRLEKANFSRSDIRRLTEKNPQKAFEISVRKGKTHKKYLLF